ncbi:MAG: ATP-binding protein, partial [Pseudomonadota bacterium]
LAAGISHDFKNLLTIMQGNLTLLGRQLAKMPDSDDKIELLDEVLLATRRGTDLTRGLLSLSQRNHLTIDTVDVAGVVEELRGLLERTFPASIKLEILLPEHPVMAECDGSYLHTALLNLALNARDAMPAGGILRLGVDQESRDGMVRLSVSDTGSGIEPDVINRIFEPLFTTKEEGQGSGLGLSMVQSFARAVGGFVTLDSRLGEGTTFQLEIPLARGREAEVPLTNLPPVEADETAFAHTILIVDDDPHIRRMLVRTLDRSDREFLEADDVASAEAVLEQKPQIDLLMTDIQMPGGRDGLDLVKSTLSRRDGLPIVVFSGSSNALQKARSALPEKVAVMSKPIDTDRLVSIVESALTSPRSIPQ